MADLANIQKTFYQNSKAQKARSCEPGSISLWLFANCWCRNHRRQGVIPREKALELGTEAEIQALVDARLWREDEDAYVFKDWSDWNPDMTKQTVEGSASYIVSRILPNHPKATQDRLADEVLKLMDEGVPRRAIEAGLRKWRGRDNARFSWLPYFVSDWIRESESGVHAAIKEARNTGKLSPLVAFGYRYESPDMPEGMTTADQVREWSQKCKLAWLDQIEAEIGNT